MLAGEHVPDRFREAAGEVELGDLGSALFADPGFRLLIAVAVDGMRAGVGRCFDERPAEIARALFAEWPTQVALTGLVDARALAGTSWCSLDRRVGGSDSACSGGFEPV